MLMDPQRRSAFDLTQYLRQHMRCFQTSQNMDVIAGAIDGFGNNFHIAKYSSKIRVQFGPPGIRDHSSTSFRTKHDVIVKRKVS